MWPPRCNQHFQHLDWTQEVNAVGSSAQTSKDSRTLIHYCYLKVYNQKLSILVHNFRESPFRSLTLIWTPRISTCFNSSSSWSNYSAIVICNSIIPCNQTGLQENDTSTAEDLNVRKKKNTAVYFYKQLSSAAIMPAHVWSKGSTFASLMISNEDFLTWHSVPIVIPKTCGRSLKDTQRKM